MKGLFYLLVGGTPEDLRLGAGDSALKIHYNPPEKIQDVGLWASKMRLGLVSFADQT